MQEFVFTTVAALLETYAGNTGSMLGNAMLLGVTSQGVVYVPEDADFEGEKELPSDTIMVQTLNGQDATDQDAEVLSTPEIDAIVKGLDGATKVYHFAYLSTQAHLNRNSLRVGKAEAPVRRVATLRRADGKLMLSVSPLPKEV